MSEQTIARNVRTPYINNLCTVLIVLTVAGNFIDLCVDGSGLSKSLFLFIFSFHMPLLIFLAGTISREATGDKNRVMFGAASMFFLYISQKAIIWLVRLIVSGNARFSLLSDSGAPWLFFSLGAYLVFSYLTRNVNRKRLFVLTVIVALLCGYCTSVGDYLIASRTLVFLPFFVLGQICGMETANKLTGSRGARITGACVLILSLLVMVVFREHLYILRPMFTGRNSYASLGKNVQVKWAYRLAAYMMSAVLSAAVLAVTPRRNLGRGIGRPGEKFLLVYFWYRPILYILTGVHLYECLEQKLGWRMGRVAWVLCGMFVVLILSSSFLMRFCKHVFQPLILWAQECKAIFLKAFQSDDEARTEKRLWNAYMALWGRLQGWNLFFFYIIHYTILFVFCSKIIFSDFGELNKTFIWSSDAMPQYIPRLIYINRIFQDGIASLLSGKGWTIPLYDFRLGPAKLELPIELPQLLAAIWPKARIDQLYSLLTILRYYFVGISFSALGFYFRRKPLPVLTGAVAYTFSSYALYAGTRHPSFLTPMITLPVLVIAVEKILKRESPLLFIITVFFITTQSLYFACMLGILVILYVLIRFPNVYEENRKYEFRCMTGRLVCSGCTGILISAFVTFPVLLQMFGTGRIGRDVFSYTDPFRYSGTYYQRFLANYIIVPDSVGSWVHLGFPALIIPTVLILFLRRNKKERSLRYSFIILTGMLMFPAVAYLMSGFNTISNRWCFAYAFCEAVILMFELPYTVNADRTLLAQICVCIVVYLAVCYFIIDHNYYSESSCILLTLSVILLLIICAGDGYVKAAGLAICLVMVIFSSWYSSYLLFDKGQGNYISEFTTKGKVYDRYKEGQYASFKESGIGETDNNFYRVSGSDISRAEINMAFDYDINGLSFYSSIFYDDYQKWYRELELPQMDAIHRNYGVGTSAAALSLANVKYYVARNADAKKIPYGFQKIEQVDKTDYTDVILENKYALPVGYTYSSYLSRRNYDMLTALEKQEAQLQAVVLGKKPDSPDISEASLKLAAKQVPSSLLSCKDLEWDNGKVRVKEPNATMTLSFKGLPRSETYLRVVNLDLTNGASERDWYLTVNTDETSTMARFYADADVYSNGMKTQLLDLGYTEDGYTTCTITFPAKGTFILDDMQIWCLPMENYAGHVNELRQEVLENVETNWRGLTGTISVSDDKILCISVPYDKGWKAYVDGKRTELLQANTAFMAVELAAGDHMIELRYCPPGLIFGFFLSMIGILLLYLLMKSPYGKRNDSILKIKERRALL